MKRFSVIILSLLLFFNSSLFIIFYSLKTLEIKQYSKSKIQLLRLSELHDSQFSSEITVIKILTNSPVLNGSLQRINEEEIIFNGHFFDIICERIAEDTTYIFCVQDYEEDELLRTFIVHFENEKNNSQEMQYFNILLSFLSNAINQSFSCEFHLDLEQNIFPCQSKLICMGIPDIPSPPPRNPV